MKSKRRLLISGIALGAVMMLSPFIGLAGTVYGMIKAFKTLGSSGISDPTVLAQAIGEILIATFSGIIVAIPGIVLLIVCIVCLVRLNKRQATDRFAG